MSKLYPPNIEGTIPAFYKYDGTTKIIVVPFSMNKAVGKAEVGGFIAKIKTVNGDVKGTIIASSYDINSEMTATFTTSMDFNIGQYYKIQIAYIDTDGIIGYYSTVGVIKYTTLPEVYIDNLTEKELNSHKYYYTGIYSQKDGDTTEKMYSNRFYITDSSGNIIDDTGEVLHNITNDENSYESQEQYQMLSDLELDKVYYIVFSVTTTNGLTVSSKKYRITQRSSIVPEISFDLIADMDEDNGYIKLTLSNSSRKSISGTFLLSRASSANNYAWEELRRFDMHGEIASEWNMLDCIVEQGTSYKYSLQQYNENGVYSKRIISKIYNSAGKLVEKPLKADFEDMFLFDGKKQLKIKFNPKISSFKTSILENKQDTIGSKYPFISRNGNVSYKDFPISGLISYQMDDNEMFIDKDDLGLESSEIEYTKIINPSDESAKISHKINYNSIGTFTWDAANSNFKTSDNIVYQINKYYYKSLDQNKYILDGRDINEYTKNDFYYYPVKIYERKKIRPDQSEGYFYYEQSCPVCNESLGDTNPYQCPYCNSFLFVPGYFYHRYRNESAEEKQSRINDYSDNDFATLGNDLHSFEGKIFFRDDLSDGYERYSKIRGYYLYIPNQEYFTKSDETIIDSKKNIVTTYEKIYNTSLDLDGDNVAAERKFKMEVLDWLNDGNTKLFRSPTEGNFIVRLMNVSLSPMEQLGRMLHTFTCNAYEMAAFNFQNLEKFGLIDSTEDITAVMKWKTLDFVELVKSSSKLNSSSSNFFTIVEEPVYTIQFENMVPGSRIKIDDEIIVIGMTGSYVYENEENPVKIIQVQGTSLIQGQLTYGYKEAKIAMFEQISNVEISDVPLRQFIGSSYQTKDTKNILDICQDIKTKIFTIYFMRFTKRQSRDVYIIPTSSMKRYIKQDVTKDNYVANKYYIKNQSGDPSYVLSTGMYQEDIEYFSLLIQLNKKKTYQYYDDMECTNEITLDPLYLYRIRLKRDDYRYNYIQNDKYYIDAMNSYYAPYTNIMIDGNDLVMFDETSDLYEIIFNDSEVITVTDEMDYYISDTSSIESVVANRGIISELSYTKQVITYTFEDNENGNGVVLNRKQVYNNNLKSYLANRDAGIATEVELNSVKSSYDEFINQLSTVIKKFKKEYGIEE